MTILDTSRNRGVQHFTWWSASKSECQLLRTTELRNRNKSQQSQSVHSATRGRM